MSPIVLIACASKKREHRAKAADLYISDLFRLSLAFARTLRPRASFILSAKYGLLDLEDEIEPYDITLKTMSAAMVRTWADGVFATLQRRTDVEADHFIFLAGEKYRRCLAPRLRSVDVPMAGLPIGRQLQYLKRRLNE